MSQFNFFHNDWLDLSDLFSNKIGIHDCKVNLDSVFFESLKLDKESLKQYRIEAAELVYESIGEKVALCFSGGVDSQCMIQSFLEAGLDFDVFTLRFNNNLNIQDVSSAESYCNKFNIKLNYVDIDILNFLNRHNYEYGVMYQSVSPHFNVHYKLFDILRDRGYDGVVSGGNTPFFSSTSNLFISNYTRNNSNHINYTNISGYKCQGNFLSFYPKLAWAIALLSPSLDHYKPATNFLQDRIFVESMRYTQKIQGYKRAGFNVLPQSQKYTGFELVKDYLKEKTGNGWSFEQLYRYPLQKLLSENKDIDYRMTYKDDNILHTLLAIYSNNLLPGQGTSSGI